MYLTEKKNLFSVQNTKKPHTGGNFVVRCNLSHGEAAFISSRCQIISLNEQYDDGTIMITNELETMYFERIFRDIENSLNWEVFASIEMQLESNRKLFIQYSLEKMSPKFASSINDFTTPLHVIAPKGYFEFESI